MARRGGFAPLSVTNRRPTIAFDAHVGVENARMRHLGWPPPTRAGGIDADIGSDLANDGELATLTWPTDIKALIMKG